MQKIERQELIGKLKPICNALHDDGLAKEILRFSME